MDFGWASCRRPRIREGTRVEAIPEATAGVERETHFRSDGRFRQYRVWHRGTRRERWETLKRQKGV